MSIKNKIINNLENLQLQLDDTLHDECLFKSIQTEIIRDSFEYHVTTNKEYEDYVNNIQIDNPLNSKFEISKIPLLPSVFFKKRNLKISTAPPKDIVKYCTSSGTLGTKSIVPRDEETLLNFLGSITSTFPIYLGLEREGNHKVFVLGPTTEEAGDLWFSYVLSCMSLNYQTDFMEKNNTYDVNETMIKISDAIKKKNDVIILGAPFRIIELAKTISEAKTKISLGKNSYVISAGGWKKRQNESIDEIEYKEYLKYTFNRENYFFIRDSYNMVELNTVFNECEYGEKHILPWTEVIARDPKSNQPLNDNYTGILSFYDACALSYPGYILSEDFGYTYSGTCKCGRNSKRIKIIRRMNNVENRGCALKMAMGSNQIISKRNKYYTSFFRNPEKYKKEYDKYVSKTGDKEFIPGPHL